MDSKVLLVEDDEGSAYLLKEFLEEYSLKIDIVSTVTDAISNIRITKYSLILLDINLPDFNGFEVLKFLNKNNINIPTIIMSAYSDKKTKLQAFKLGVNDYMVKPIDPDELEARVWVQLKNNTQFGNKLDKKLFFIEDDMIYFDSEPLKLTKTEFEILKYFMDNKNKIISRNSLIQFLSSVVQNDRALDYHIKNIRIKIGDNGTTQKYLITEYGVGYKLIY